MRSKGLITPKRYEKGIRGQFILGLLGWAVFNGLALTYGPQTQFMAGLMLAMNCFLLLLIVGGLLWLARRKRIRVFPLPVERIMPRNK